MEKQKIYTSDVIPSVFHTDYKDNRERGLGGVDGAGEGHLCCVLVCGAALEGDQR